MSTPTSRPSTSTTTRAASSRSAEVPRAVALIPARAGSERVPGKNVRPLAGHPLLAYSIAGARESGLFEQVVVSTDSEQFAEIAARYGAEIPALRPADLASATSPDIEWVRHMLGVLRGAGHEYELFSLLRPTSPFRSADTIRRAWDLFVHRDPPADSVRAVELCRQHPGKMWVLEGDLMRPLLEQAPGEVPMHSRQYKSLPEVYVQNSSLEIAWTRITAEGEIAGASVMPFLTDPLEGFTIDYEDDWARAEQLVASGEAVLPRVGEPAAEARG
jgi:CMP-N,N'-diacetyllegionaminic acid synthase